MSEECGLRRCEAFEVCVTVHTDESCLPCPLSCCLYYRLWCFMRGLLFLSHCGLFQHRLGAWAAEWGREAALFFSSGCFHSLWMIVILGNAPHEQWRKPLSPAELLRESVFDKRLPQRAPLIKRVKAWSYPPALWSFCLLLDITGIQSKKKR